MKDLILMISKPIALGIFFYMYFSVMRWDNWEWWGKEMNISLLLLVVIFFVSNSLDGWKTLIDEDSDFTEDE